MPDSPQPDEDLSPALGGSAAEAGAGGANLPPPGGWDEEARLEEEVRAAREGARQAAQANASVVIEGELGAVVEALTQNLSRAIEQATGALERELPQAIDRLGRQVPEAASRLESQLPQALEAIGRLANVFEAAFTPILRPVAEAVDRAMPPDLDHFAPAAGRTPPPSAAGAATPPAAPPAPPSGSAPPNPAPGFADGQSIPVDDE